MVLSFEDHRRCLIFRVIEFIACILCTAFAIILFAKLYVTHIVILVLLIGGIMFTFITVFDLIAYTMQSQIQCYTLWILYATFGMLIFFTAAGLLVVQIATYSPLMVIFALALALLAGVVFLLELISILRNLAKKLPEDVQEPDEPEEPQVVRVKQPKKTQVAPARRAITTETQTKDVERGIKCDACKDGEDPIQCLAMKAKQSRGPTPHQNEEYMDEDLQSFIAAREIVVEPVVKPVVKPVVETAVKKAVVQNAPCKREKSEESFDLLTDFRAKHNELDESFHKDDEYGTPELSNTPELSIAPDQIICTPMPTNEIPEPGKKYTTTLNLMLVNSSVNTEDKSVQVSSPIGPGFAARVVPKITENKMVQYPSTEKCTCRLCTDETSIHTTSTTEENYGSISACSDEKCNTCTTQTPPTQDIKAQQPLFIILKECKGNNCDKPQNYPVDSDEPQAKKPRMKDITMQVNNIEEPNRNALTETPFVYKTKVYSETRPGIVSPDSKPSENSSPQFSNAGKCGCYGISPMEESICVHCKRKKHKQKPLSSRPESRPNSRQRHYSAPANVVFEDDKLLQNQPFAKTAKRNGLDEKESVIERTKLPLQHTSPKSTVKHHGVVSPKTDSAQESRMVTPDDSPRSEYQSRYKKHPQYKSIVSGQKTARSEPSPRTSCCCNDIDLGTNTGFRYCKVHGLRQMHSSVPASASPQRGGNQTQTPNKTKTGDRFANSPDSHK